MNQKIRAFIPIIPVKKSCGGDWDEYIWVWWRETVISL